MLVTIELSNSDLKRFKEYIEHMNSGRRDDDKFSIGDAVYVLASVKLDERLVQIRSDKKL